MKREGEKYKRWRDEERKGAKKDRRADRERKE